MAYPTVSGPYGLIPVKMLSGTLCGCDRQYKIASGYGTSIFAGDAVKLVTGGTVERDTFDAAMTPIGVFMGVSYTDSTLGKVFRQYFPASTAADDIMATSSMRPTCSTKRLLCLRARPLVIWRRLTSVPTSLVWTTLEVRLRVIPVLLFLTRPQPLPRCLSASSPSSKRLKTLPVVSPRRT